VQFNLSAWIRLVELVDFHVVDLTKVAALRAKRATLPVTQRPRRFAACCAFAVSRCRSSLQQSSPARVRTNFRSRNSALSRTWLIMRHPGRQIRDKLCSSQAGMAAPMLRESSSIRDGRRMERRSCARRLGDMNLVIFPRQHNALLSAFVDLHPRPTHSTSG